MERSRQLVRNISGQKSGKTDVINFHMPTSSNTKVVKNKHFSNCNKMIWDGFQVSETFTNIFVTVFANRFSDLEKVYVYKGQNVENR